MTDRIIGHLHIFPGSDGEVCIQGTSMASRVVVKRGAALDVARAVLEVAGTAPLPPEPAAAPPWDNSPLPSAVVEREKAKAKAALSAAEKLAEKARGIFGVSAEAVAGAQVLGAAAAAASQMTPRAAAADERRKASPAEMVTVPRAALLSSLQDAFEGLGLWPHVAQDEAREKVKGIEAEAAKLRGHDESPPPVCFARCPADMPCPCRIEADAAPAPGPDLGALRDALEAVRDEYPVSWNTRQGSGAYGSLPALFHAAVAAGLLDEAPEDPAIRLLRRLRDTAGLPSWVEEEAARALHSLQEKPRG